MTIVTINNIPEPRKAKKLDKTTQLGMAISTLGIFLSLYSIQVASLSIRLVRGPEFCGDIGKYEPVDWPSGQDFFIEHFINGVSGGDPYLIIYPEAKSPTKDKASGGDNGTPYNNSANSSEKIQTPAIVARNASDYKAVIRVFDPRKTILPALIKCYTLEVGDAQRVNIALTQEQLKTIKSELGGRTFSYQIIYTDTIKDEPLRLGRGHKPLGESLYLINSADAVWDPQGTRRVIVNHGGQTIHPHDANKSDNTSNHSSSS